MTAEPMCTCIKNYKFMDNDNYIHVTLFLVQRPSIDMLQMVNIIFENKLIHFVMV